MFFDFHAHVSKYPYPTPSGFNLFCSPEELLDFQELHGIKRAVLLPVVSSEVYMPQSVGEIIELAGSSHGRWIAFCNIDPRVYNNSGDSELGMLLEFYREQGCLGLGEVMPNLEWRDARLSNLLFHTQRVGFPMVFDVTGRKNYGYGIYDDPGLPQLRDCLEKYTDLIFIGHGPAFWAEMGTLRDPGDRLGYPAYALDAEGAVPRLMRSYKNLWVDLSATSGCNALKRDEAYAPHFLNEFQDKILFGTDICYKNQRSEIGSFLTSLKLTGKITDNVFKKIAWQNAQRLLGLSETEEF